MLQIGVHYSPDMAFIGRNEECKPLDHDLHCPEIGIAGMNHTKAGCIRSQRKGGGCYATRCKVGHEISGIVIVAQKPRQPPIGPCECGQPSKGRDRLQRARIDGPMCQSCYDAEIKRRKNERDRVRKQSKKQVTAERRRIATLSKLEAKRAAIEAEIEAIDRPGDAEFCAMAKQYQR